MKEPLLCSVTAVDHRQVTLRAPDGQSFTLPLGCIHGTPILEGTVRLMGISPDGGRVDESLFAKTVLNELLSPPRP